MPPPSAPDPADATARLMLVAVSLCWGLSWPVMKIALVEIPPFSMRVGTSGLATMVLLVLALLQRRNLRVGGVRACMHLAVAGCLNVAFFTILTAFAQLTTTTSRVAVLTYTMPIWAALMARVVLGERITLVRGIALGLCVAGLAVLVQPLIGTGDLLGSSIALTTAVTWAAGTVYLKWARIKADPMAIALWQMVVALVPTIAGLLIVEGSLHLWSAHPLALSAVAFSGVFGAALAYLLWFEIVRRLPATTASLGVLSAPVVGVVGSTIVLGERPTVHDVIGFAFILGAAALVLLAPGVRAREAAPIEQ
jgi:drug/metabolite transporter (DMT)-like permease